MHIFSGTSGRKRTGVERQNDTWSYVRSARSVVRVRSGGGEGKAKAPCARRLCCLALLRDFAGAPMVPMPCPRVRARMERQSDGCIDR